MPAYPPQRDEAGEHMAQAGQTEFFLPGHCSWFKDEHVTHNGQSKSFSVDTRKESLSLPLELQALNIFCHSKEETTCKLLAMDKNKVNMQREAELREGEREL